MKPRRAIPRISVLVPAYNAQAYLREAIESVLADPREDLQLVVVDDGSIDDTAAILASYVDPRLKIVHQTNSGLPEARNAGIRNSEGEYLVFFDADDIYAPEALDPLIRALETKPGSVLSYGRYERFFGSPERTVRGPADRIAGRPEGDVLRAILQANFIGALGACCVPRWAIERAGPFNSRLKMCEDWEYYCRLAAVGPFVFVPEVRPLLYRQHPASMSASLGSEMSAYEDFTNTVFSAPAVVRRFPARELARIRKSHLAHLHAYISLRLLDANRVTDSIAELVSAVRLFPPRAIEFAGRFAWRMLNRRPGTRQ